MDPDKKKKITDALLLVPFYVILTFVVITIFFKIKDLLS